MQKIQKVTLDTIAKKLGVSKVTVSKALHHQPGVSKELKKRILEMTADLGYTSKRIILPPNQVVKLGLLVPKRFFLDTDNFYTKIYYHLNSECSKEQINLSLYILQPEEEISLLLPLSLDYDANELDGLFVAGEVHDKYMQRITSLNLPIIAIDFYKPDFSFDCIVTDNYRTGYEITNYLIERGHTSVGFVGNPNFTHSVMDRFCGYIKALTRHGLEYSKEWHIVNNDEFGVYNHDYSLPQPLPSAYVCHCDMAASKLIFKLQSIGVSVPDQLSIVSFDNTELSETIEPALTTIDISKSDFAIKALKRMLWRINHPNEDPQYIFIKTRLIERNSVSSIKIERGRSHRREGSL